MGTLSWEKAGISIRYACVAVKPAAGKRYDKHAST